MEPLAPSHTNPDAAALSINQILKLLEQPGFSQNIHVQHQAMLWAWKEWRVMGDAERALVQSKFTRAVPRCLRAPNPEETFRLLLCLSEAEDIYRGLLVGEKPLPNYDFQLDEKIYPQEGWVGAYLQYAKHNQSNLAFHFWSAISVLGSFCHRNVYMEMGSFRIHMNNYVVLTGSSSSGKSIAKNIALDVLHRANKTLVETDRLSPRAVHQLPGDVTVEGIVKELAERRVTGPKGDSILADATALGVIDEIATFLSRDAFNIRKRIPLLTELFDTDYYCKGTASEGRLELRNVALSLLMLGAPDWFRDNVTEDIRKGGFLDRCLFIHRNSTNRCYPLPLPPLDPLVGEALAAELVGLTDSPKLIMRATLEGQQWYEDWYRRVWDKNRADRQGSEVELDGKDGERSVNRRSVLLWKMSSLLSLSYHEAPMISLSRLEEAEKILGQEDSCLQRLLSLVDRTPQANVYQKILGYIQRKGGCATQSQLTGNFKNTVHGGSQALQHLLKTLLDAGELSMVNGKPKVWFLPDHEECKRCEATLRPVKIGGSK